jgi:large subunit ribosomal protein L35
MRRPKGIKTKKSIAKRFRITATGKVMHSSPGRRHLLSSKNAKRRRRLSKVAQLSKREAHKVILSLPFSH